MNIISIDLEWNQPQIAKKRVKGLYGEIIQIGAIKLDENLKELDRFCVMIKPKYYRSISREVRELTLITNEQLEAGIPFEEAIARFKEWCGEDCVLASWGPTDVDMLINNLQMYNMDYAWIPETYDAQLMFDDVEMRENRQWALNYALYYYKEKPTGAHDALADAYSTVLIMRHFDIAECLRDEYFKCA